MWALLFPQGTPGPAGPHQRQHQKSGPEAGAVQDASSRRLARVKSHLLVFWSAHSSGRRPSRADPVVGGGRPDQGRVDTVTAPSFAESAPRHDPRGAKEISDLRCAMGANTRSRSHTPNVDAMCKRQSTSV